ncbi:MAG: Crp/Fnr family transcriptional regulator [Candidatus Promineofilum sp.]|nr:Crp/Fnr family transcriptional regulator [Promineifilum sp.]
MAKRRKRSPVELKPVEPHMCDIPLRLKILQRLPFFTSLTAQEITEINTLFREVGFEAQESIYHAGDPAIRLYVVAAGIVKIMRHALNGQEILLDILTSGEFFGSLSLTDDDTYSDTAIAQTAACTLSISKSDFRSILARYPTVALAILDITSKRLHEAHETIRQISAHTVEERTAHTLVKLAEKLGEPHDVGLLIQTPLSREDLAGMVSSTPESVSRIISQFQKADLIDTGRQWIAITNLPRLREVANISD